MVEPIGGAAAIMPKPLGQGPKAKRKVVQGPDGTPHVVYVDLDTGQELQNLSGYNIVEGSTYSDLDSLGLSPTGPEKEKETTAQKSIASVTPNRGEGGRDTKPSGPDLGRSQANNFGYINQPGAMGIASMIPGPIGTAAKAAKVGMGMNNNAAVNAARSRMGLPEQSFGASVKGAVKDQKGFVADVDVNGTSYGVGLEAVDSRGMTMMTPDEAAARARANNVKVGLATPEQVTQREEDFSKAYGKPSGIFSGLVSSATSFIDDIFDNEDDVSKSIREQNSGSNFSPTKSGFGDMIGATSGVGKNATSTPNSPVSGASRSTAGKTSGGIGNSGRSDSSGGRSNPGTSGNMGKGGGTTSGHGPGIGSA